MATIPAIGLFTKFAQMQKFYAVIGALFMPMLALVLLILNGRKDWVGEKNSNRPMAFIALMATLVMFSYFGFRKIKKTLAPPKPPVEAVEETPADVKPTEDAPAADGK